MVRREHPNTPTERVRFQKQFTVVAIKCKIRKHSLIRETGISPMEINLAPAQQAVIESLVSTGRFKSVDDVIIEGVKLY